MELQKPIRPLVLAFWTPPIVRPQAMLIGKMLPEWLRQGLEPTLVFYEESGVWDLDIPKLAIKRFEPKGFWKIPYFNFFAQYLHWRRITNEINSFVAQHEVDIIYSFANPVESNIIGAMLARKTGIPYVAHFSDPWQSTMRHHSLLGSLKIGLLERFVVKVADRITTPDEAMQMHIAGKYSKTLQQKFTIVNHCYDPKEYSTEKERPAHLRDKFVISHIGSFYKNRTPEVLLSAVSRMTKAHPELRAKVVVELIGGVSIYGGLSEDVLRELINRYGIAELVHVLPPVEYHESLKHMCIADVLVVIDMSVSYFIAMKLVDYAGAGRPIVTITSPTSSNARVTKQLGYSVFSPDQVEELANHFYLLIKKQYIQEPNTRFRETFHVTKTTQVLSGIFEEVLLAKG